MDVLGAHSTLIHAAVSGGKLCPFVSNSFTYSSTNRKAGHPPPPPHPTTTPPPALTLLSHDNSSSATNIGVQEAAEHGAMIYRAGPLQR